MLPVVSMSFLASDMLALPSFGYTPDVSRRRWPTGWALGWRERKFAGRNSAACRRGASRVRRSPRKLSVSSSSRVSVAEHGVGETASRRKEMVSGPCVSRSSVGSCTSSLNRRDCARRVVVHLLLKRPTAPSLRPRALRTPPALRILTSSSSRCARTPAGTRFWPLGIMGSPPAACDAGGQGQEESARQPLRQASRQGLLQESGGRGP